MSKPHVTMSAALLSKRPAPSALGKDDVLSIVECLIGPAVIVFSLWVITYIVEGELRPQYVVLSSLVFALTFPSDARLQSSVWGVVVNVCTNWLWIACLLLGTGYATGYLRDFSSQVIMPWLWTAPLSELAACLVLRQTAQVLLRREGAKQRAIIVGMNEQGIALADKICDSVFTRIVLEGFVDSRNIGRLDLTSRHKLIDRLDRLAHIVKERNIGVIYLSLPMASQPRILQVLDELKDTTASIYFVPDMFVTDLIQGHPGSVCGTPVISVCETPFRGADGVIKRLSDIGLSLVILALVAPLLLLIAIAVKLDSPGPVIFKQRRYGLDGEQIVVYKFRSMTVTEDGDTIRQAQVNDQRTTRLGAFLRRTSLDELPQFVNVLQGRMSIVGPRPHAVAHNELYRKLIKGYMVRHKVKPGITGWAQVNGYRGETRTLDKMQARIDFDLDYLRNWSLRLDIRIILETVRLVLRDQRAR